MSRRIELPKSERMVLTYAEATYYRLARQFFGLSEDEAKEYAFRVGDQERASRRRN